ncbi:hypothetical protein HDU67_000911 [Dinochytrium kinnereticum]|nr:hypothetical protein HDU67_000911 [Dinochytrium kinnereticum]
MPESNTAEAVTAVMQEGEQEESVSIIEVPEGVHLDRLKSIRDRLFNLRKASGSGRQSKETAFLWKEVSVLVKSLSEIRTKNAENEEDDGSAISMEMDQILEDIIPMFFQFWSSNGKVSENMYPVYVKLAKMKHTLEHLNDSGLYTSHVVSETEAKLKDLKEKVHAFAVAQESKDRGNKKTLALLQSKLTACVQDLATLKESLSSISPALLPVHTRLNEIKQELQNLLRRGSSHAFSLAEVQMLQDELREIDSVRIDGSYLGRDGTVLPGQAAVIALIESAYDDVHELLSMREAIAGDNPLRSVYEKLIKIKANLERIQMVYRWALKAEDLVQLQIELGAIDNLRVDGKFLDDKGQVPEGQAVLHFLLHKCYRIIYKLQSTAEETVSEFLIPIRNQLVTLKKCLQELQRWKVSLSPRELMVYQMRLASLDNMRVDGKYLDDEGNVPEGQGILHGLLNENYDILRDLQHAAEEAEGDTDFFDEEEEEEDEDEEGECPFPVHDAPIPVQST